MAYQNNVLSSANQNSFLSMANQNNQFLMITGADSKLNDYVNAPTCPDVKRADFPEDFVFGAATSAYQVCLILFACRDLLQQEKGLTFS